MRRRLSSKPRRPSWKQSKGLPVREEEYQQLYELDVKRRRFEEAAEHETVEEPEEAKGETKELELVRADLGALFEQLHALRSHLGVGFVSKQLEPV